MVASICTAESDDTSFSSISCDAAVDNSKGGSLDFCAADEPTFLSLTGIEATGGMGMVLVVGVGLRGEGGDDGGTSLATFLFGKKLSLIPTRRRRRGSKAVSSRRSG